MSQDEIDTIKVWVAEKGQPPVGAGIRKKVNPGDISKPFEFDIWADWIPDGVSKVKVADLSFSYGGQIPPANKPPIADAGADQIVLEKSTVILDASKSTDPDGSIVAFKWIQTSGTPLVTLVNADKGTCTFVAPDVSTVEPDQPRAILTVLPSSIVKFGDLVTLDATGSVYDVLNISQTSGASVSLQQILPTKWTFTAPQTEGILGFQLQAAKGISQALANVTVQVKPQIEPEPDGGDVDAFGMKILMKTTANKVTMERGSDHRNGQRFSVNHQYENHLMQGFFRLGQGQDKIETKEDGPNHGSCDFTKDQICFWWEAGLRLATGKGESQYEWPHADNYPIADEKNAVLESVGPLKAGNWCGWATACYWDKTTGLRQYKAWCDPNPFPNNDPTQKPLNNWKLVIHLIHTADLITKPTPITIPRDMQKVKDYDQGFECEIRMNKGTNHDTDFKNCFVYEIAPSPSVAATALALEGDAKLPPEEQKQLGFQLTVTDNKGATANDTVNITVTKTGPGPTKKPPVASFTYDPLFPRSGTVVTFDSSASTDPDGTIVSRLWTSPDVSFNNAMGVISFCTFPEGKSSISTKLTVTDNDGLTGSVTKTITVEGQVNEKIIIAHLGDTHGQNVQKEIVQKHKPTFIIHSGDVTNTESDDDNYIKYMSELNLTYGKDFANSQGNHESPEESGEGAQDDLENAYPALASNKWMQNYQIGNVFIIIGNTQISGYSQPDSVHMTFIKNSLEKAKQLRQEGQIDWVFYAQHKPFYTMKANHDPDYNFRYNVQPFFDEAGLDVSVHGHVHNGQRTKPITFGGPANAPPVINSKMVGEAHDLSQIPHGHMNCINGSSTKLASFSGNQDAWTAYSNDNDNSYTVFTIEGKKLTGQYIEVDTGRVLHTFSATKEQVNA